MVDKSKDSQFSSEYMSVNDEQCQDGFEETIDSSRKFVSER